MFTKQSLFLKKHSRRVLIFKHALPVFAFLLAAIIVAWPLLTPEKERFDLPIQKANIKTPSVDMENISFFARDDKDNNMIVVAQSVKEIDPSQKIARLESPIGTYVLVDKDVLTSKTSYGLAYQQEKYFFFDQPITTTTKSGYTAHNQNVKATYDGILDSDHSIKVSGPDGTLVAEGFHLMEKGNLIDFKGKTETKVKQGKGTVFIKTENGLYIDRSKRTLTGQKNVQIRHQGNTLNADTVILHYTNNKNNRVQKIYASGHVVVDNGKNKITGNEGTYNPITEEMEMLGDVRLYQGESFVSAQKATLNMKTGKSQLQNNSNGGRIKGILLPGDLKKRDKK